MRDLRSYPITAEEVAECCERLAAEFAVNEGDEGGAGSMDPALLTTAAAVVRAAHGMLEGIDRRLAVEGRAELRWVTPWDAATNLMGAFQTCNPKP